MTVKALLTNMLDSLGYPVFLQGSILPEQEYPDSFITFFTLSSDDKEHFDNEVSAWSWLFQVAFYSADPELVESVPATIRKTLKNAGFIPQGKGIDILSDEPTHTGWVQEFYFIERNDKNE